jgi:hypothetical protein
LVTVPALPVIFALIVPAEKLPEASRATIAPGVLRFVAVVAELGMDVRLAPEPENKPAVIVPETPSEASPLIAPPVIETAFEF